MDQTEIVSERYVASPKLTEMGIWKEVVGNIIIDGQLRIESISSLMQCLIW